MFVRFSPVKTQKKKAHPPEEEVEILVLAQFTRTPKLAFESIPLGKTTCQKLIIKNPSQNVIYLQVVHDIPPDMQVNFSFLEVTIDKGAETTLEITWTPVAEVACRNNIVFKDFGSLRKAVPIAFKSIAKKSTTKTKNKVYKSPRCQPKRSPRKSPTVKYYPSPKRLIKPTTHVQKSSPVNPNSFSGGKENRDPLNFYFESPAVDPRRETYTLRKVPYFDSLENVQKSPLHNIQNSPLSETNLLDISLNSYLRMNLNENSRTSSPIDGNFLSPSSILREQNVDFKHGRKFNTLCPILESTNDNKDKLSSDDFFMSTSYQKLKPEILFTEDSTNGKHKPSANSTMVRSLSNISLASATTYNLDDKERTYNVDKKECNFSGQTYTLNNEDDIADLKSIQYELEQISEARSGFKRKYNLSNVQEEDQYSYGVPNKKLNKTSNDMSWSKTGGRAFRVAKQSSGINFQKNTLAANNFSMSISKTDTSFLVIQNPFLLAATNLIDPFMTKDIKIDEDWVCEQQIYFKRWLNKILSPPPEFTTKTQNVDVAKIWRECTAHSETLGQNDTCTTTVSKNLLKIQVALKEIFLSLEVSNILKKVCESVNLGKISIREDRVIHLNVGIKQGILKLLLSYHPLWLRIGMEIIFSKNIPLKSNDDTVGLSHFIMNNFLKDDKLLRKHKSAHAPKYKFDLNKHFLIHYFSLVLVLDKAKNKKIIPHDPCLFCRGSAIKESREMLLYLSRELISSVGDITKVLKSYGYIVTHVQTYIHEFDHRVENLGVDLRDGVRLTKVAELILNRDDLTDQLRVPAISRLQKIHNVQLVFDALKSASYDILYGVTPKDIVDGHKEKTLSFLWQIIYKFEAPLMFKKATVIQNWYRSLPIVLKRRILKKERLRKENAVKLIQNWYRRLKLSRKLFEVSNIIAVILNNSRRERAAIRIQSYYRMYRCRKSWSNQIKCLKGLQCRCKGWLVRNIHINRIKFVHTLVINVQAIKTRYQEYMFYQAVIFIQTRFKANQACKIERSRFLLLKAATICIQRRYRAISKMKTNKTYYSNLKAAAICIQRHYRSRQTMLHERYNYRKLKNACITVQQKFKALQAMKMQRIAYLKLKYAAICIQRRFRAKRAMTFERNKYLEIQKATKTIQQTFRALQDMRRQRLLFMKLRQTTIFIQRRFRANKLMVTERSRYLQIQRACRTIQQKIKATQKMKKEKLSFLQLKKATICIQTRYRAHKSMIIERIRFLQIQMACRAIQQKFRALQKMRIDRVSFIQLKSATVLLQRRFRANKAMAAERSRYIHLQVACRTIQQRFRATQTMKKERMCYIKMKSFTILIQRRFRAQKSMVVERNRYLQLQKACLTVQQKFWATKLMKKQRLEFIKLRQSVITIQRRFRANKTMKVEQKMYIQLKYSCRFVQQRFRAIQLMRKERMIYLKLKQSTIFLQRLFRANRSMITERNRFLKLQAACRTVQQKFRGLRLMRRERVSYLKLKESTICIQRRYKAKKCMITDRTNYLQLRKVCITVQRQFRARKMMKLHRMSYLILKGCVISIQRRFRANKSMVIQKKRYLQLQKACKIIQHRFRALILMKKERMLYEKLKQATVTIQRRFRANKAMVVEQKKFMEIQLACRTIQQRFRATQIMRQERMFYTRLKLSTICIQMRFRALKLIKIERNRYLRLQVACKAIQTRYRALSLMRKEQMFYMKLRESTICIQRRFRANKSMIIDRNNYLKLKDACITIQQRFRAVKMMRKNRTSYQNIRSYTIFIQRQFRAHKSMIAERNRYLQIKVACQIIQEKYRALCLMRKERILFVKLKETTIFIQRQFRANRMMLNVRNEYLQLQIACKLIQQRFRATQIMRKEKQSYAKLKNTTILIQRRFRANKAMIIEQNNYLLLKWASKIIQVKFRGLLLMREDRSSFLRLKQSTICIQRCFRAKKLMLLERKKYCELRSAVILIQRKFRALMQQPDSIIKKRRAVIKIQALWKGYKCRVAASNECEAIRKRIEFANVNAGSTETLGERGKNALDTILSRNCSLLILSKALEDIALITRRSKEVCYDFSKKITSDLYMTLSATGRSLPETVVNVFSLDILINFYKYDKSRQFSFIPSGMDAVITLMLHFCDKESPVFPTACTLLWLFAHKKEWKECILNCDIQHKIHKIETLLSRKVTMVSKSRSKVPSVFRKTENLYIPYMSPDWGLDLENKPFKFQNAPYAFKCLRKILEI